MTLHTLFSTATTYLNNKIPETIILSELINSYKPSIPLSNTILEAFNTTLTCDFHNFTLSTPNPMLTKKLIEDVYAQQSSNTSTIDLLISDSNNCLYHILKQDKYLTIIPSDGIALDNNSDAFNEYYRHFFCIFILTLNECILNDSVFIKKLVLEMAQNVKKIEALILELHKNYPQSTTTDNPLVPSTSNILVKSYPNTSEVLTSCCLSKLDLQPLVTEPPASIDVSFTQITDAIDNLLTNLPPSQVYNLYMKVHFPIAYYLGKQNSSINARAFHLLSDAPKPSTEKWEAVKELPALSIPKRSTPIHNQLGLCISITHDISFSAAKYLDSTHQNILLAHITFEDKSWISNDSVKNDMHAKKLANSVATYISRLFTEFPNLELHLFCAAPVHFAYFLGTSSRYWNKIHWYQFIDPRKKPAIPYFELAYL